MKNVLYIGNSLRQKHSNVSYIGVLGPLLEQEGYQLYYASSKQNKPFRLFDMSWCVMKFSKKVDYVLIDTYSTQNFYYAFLVSQLCRFLKLPYIPILHGGNLPKRLTANPRMSAMIFKHAFCNVAPSNYLKEQFLSQDCTNLKYIPNTIDIGNYPFIARRDFTNLRLLWVRSFSSIYNPLLAVTVLKKLNDLGYDANLCMVGPDSDGTLQEVKALAHSLQVDVKFTGKLSKAEWIALSKDYNVFINTTTIDNMPVSVIEAMALGLPVVSTNVGGMPYLIEHGTHGLLVDNGAVDEMANAITLILKDAGKRNEMVLKARALAETFDWEQVKERWKEVLE